MPKPTFFSPRITRSRKNSDFASIDRRKALLELESPSSSALEDIIHKKPNSLTKSVKRKKQSNTVETYKKSKTNLGVAAKVFESQEISKFVSNSILDKVFQEISDNSILDSVSQITLDHYSLSGEASNSKIGEEGILSSTPANNNVWGKLPGFFTGNVSDIAGEFEIEEHRSRDSELSMNNSSMDVVEEEENRIQ